MSSRKPCPLGTLLLVNLIQITAARYYVTFSYLYHVVVGIPFELACSGGRPFGTSLIT